MAEKNIQERVRKYEIFLNEVLKEDLRKLEKNMTAVNAEIADLYQQKHTLKIVNDENRHPDGFKSQVDVGCNFFMEAKVVDTSTMLFHIGLFHFLEFSLEEANKHLDVRLEAFEERASELKKKSAATKAHIKMMLFHIGELQSVSEVEK